MTFHYPATQFATDIASVQAPRAPHVFDLHPALHVAVFGGFFVYLAIMWASFADSGLAIPFAVFAVFLAASFAVPAWWTRIVPDAGPRERWADFMAKGIDCATGRLDAGAAMVQVLIMPAMLIIWGLAVAIIHAAV